MTAVAQPRSVVAAGWIESQAFDLSAFILAPLGGLLAIAASGWGRGGTAVIVALTYFVGIPHYLSSFTFFLGDDTLAYYRSRRLVFFAGPVAILALVALLRATRVDGPVLCAMYLWNIWHVSLQSAGILSIYRRLNGGPVDERRLAHLTLLLVGAAMALWHVDRFPPLFEPLSALVPEIVLVLRLLLGPAAVLCVGVLGWRILRRPQPISIAEGGFLLASLALFHPYLWVRDANQATFAMLMGHFIQYLSIVWLLHRRKYAGRPGSRHQRWLGAVSGSPVLLGATLIGAGLTFYFGSSVATALGAPMAYVTLWNAMTLVHFYLDGFIWAFRRSEVRETLGRVLMPPERIVAR